MDWIREKADVDLRKRYGSKYMVPSKVDECDLPLSREMVGDDRVIRMKT
jgi:hypothetical protein